MPCPHCPHCTECQHRKFTKLAYNRVRCDDCGQFGEEGYYSIAWDRVRKPTPVSAASPCTHRRTEMITQGFQDGSDYFKKCLDCGHRELM